MQTDVNSKLAPPAEKVGKDIAMQVGEQVLACKRNTGAQEATSTNLKWRGVDSLRDLWRNTNIATFQRVTSLCPRFCGCVCHKTCRITFPKSLAPLVGHLSIAASGMYMIYYPCNETTCLRQSIPRAEMSYRFPLWLLPRVLHLFVGMSPGEGPTFSLRTTRVVADHAEIMNLAKSGSVDGVKLLFQRGLASPNDVNSSCGVPILSVSIS
jgi:hypothetical protein